MTKEASDGSTASYYDLPAGAQQLGDLIAHRNMNHSDGEMFCALYRKGLASHSDALRDARKVLYYAQAEVKRLEALAAPAKPMGDLIAIKLARLIGLGRPETAELRALPGEGLWELSLLDVWAPSDQISSRLQGTPIRATSFNHSWDGRLTIQGRIDRVALNAATHT